MARHCEGSYDPPTVMKVLAHGAPICISAPTAASSAIARQTVFNIREYLTSDTNNSLTLRWLSDTQTGLLMKQVAMPKKATGKQSKAPILKASVTYATPTPKPSISKADQEDGPAESDWDSPDTIAAKVVHVLKSGVKQAPPRSETEPKTKPKPEPKPEEEEEDWADAEPEVQPEDRSITESNTEPKGNGTEAEAQLPLKGSVTESDTEPEGQDRAFAEPDMQPEAADGRDGSATEPEMEPEAQQPVLTSTSARPSSVIKKPAHTLSCISSVSKSRPTCTPSCSKLVSAAQPYPFWHNGDAVLDVNDQSTSSRSHGGTNEDVPVPLLIWNDWFIPLWCNKCATFSDLFHIPQMVKHVQELYDWCFPEEPHMYHKKDGAYLLASFYPLSFFLIIILLQVQQ
ncbi:hypothetical protein EWM64_g7754 [Hericium alpestre]|uniref:Uncharacterized protein n=1 Tax=Hericium alpestre TaxID=135208 RepID=A0A4Y9ZRX5_9AGAM|nr:hypothetical protein EWM64_g7754 [Hericium alpestre]